MMKVTNFRIEIADTTSRMIYAPIYEMPLIKAKWAAFPLDPINGITSGPIPANPVLDPMRETKFESIAEEVGRLRRKYATDPRTRGPLFDLVYPADAAHKAVQAEVDRCSGKTPEASRFEQPKVVKAEAGFPDEWQLEKIHGIGAALAEVFRKAGFKNAKDVAGSSVGALEKLPGVGMASAGLILQSARAIVFRVPDEPAPTKNSTPEAAPTKKG